MILQLLVVVGEGTLKLLICVSVVFWSFVTTKWKKPMDMQTFNLIILEMWSDAKSCNGKCKTRAQSMICECLGMASDVGPCHIFHERPWDVVTVRRLRSARLSELPVFQSGKLHVHKNAMVILKQTQERAPTLTNQFLAFVLHTHDWFHVPAHCANLHFLQCYMNRLKKKKNTKRMKVNIEGDKIKNLFLCCFFKYWRNDWTLLSRPRWFMFLF